MSKILSAITLSSVFFSCYSIEAVDDFIPLSDNEYIQHHSETSEFNDEVDVGFFTSTHIFTRKEGNPSDFRDIQKIEYTTSGVSFFRNPYTNQCYIDIYHPDLSNSRKCRIFGYNGRDITTGSRSFSVYKVLSEFGSFTYDKPRLIYVTTSGLYIVSESNNSLMNVSSRCLLKEKSLFDGEIIKISAVDGRRTINGQDIGPEHFSDSKDSLLALLNLNCKADAEPIFPDEESPISTELSSHSFVNRLTSKIKSFWKPPRASIRKNDSALKDEESVKIENNAAENYSVSLATEPTTER